MSKDTRVIPTGFEKAFLTSWDEWDECGDAGFQFYNADLAVDIGQYKAGTRIGCVTVLLDDCLIQIYPDLSKETYDEFELSIGVGKHIKSVVEGK